MQPFKNKKIILAITADVELFLCIEENLKYIGFKVFTITYNNDFKYSSFKYKVLNFIHKNFLFNKTYKSKLKKKIQYNKTVKEIDLIPEVDYSFTIRADLFNQPILDKIIVRSDKNYAYQWDGLSRFEGIQKLIPLFDKFYVFDKNDIYKERTYPTTNFYFDCFDFLFEEKKPEYDFFYIGSYDSRIDDLLIICDYLYSKNYKLNIILRTINKNVLQDRPYISFIKEPTSYFKNLENVANARFLIDLKQGSIHEGLSFRIFEALGYNKKIITTNHIVKKYDFYNPENIFYVDDTLNLEFIDNFLNSPYSEISVEIKNKYSFSNWIKYILEIDNHIPINIP